MRRIVKYQSIDGNVYDKEEAALDNDANTVLYDLLGYDVSKVPTEFALIKRLLEKKLIDESEVREQLAIDDYTVAS